MCNDRVRTMSDGNEYDIYYFSRGIRTLIYVKQEKIEKSNSKSSELKKKKAIKEDKMERRQKKKELKDLKIEKQELKDKINAINLKIERKKIEIIKIKNN
jgi:septal ring factor EnvC (AmiA/AmiB activator)